MADRPSSNLSAQPVPELKMTAPSPVAIPVGSPKVDSAKKPERKWNTKNLGGRLATDVVSAGVASGMIAPVISIIDKSIMENASGRATVGQSLASSFRTLLFRPQNIIFAKPFALIVMVYGGTYLTANTLDTAESTVRNRPATYVTSGTAKFAASSAANAGLTILKDRAFVRMFGAAGAAPRAVPLSSYALFAARDCLTIFASFNVPPILGPWLTERMSTRVQAAFSGQTAAQFAAPALVQAISTPLHLLGLDLYNRPWTERERGPSWRERAAIVGKNWAVSSAARVCRIVPAFGIGGVVNMKMRKNLMEKLA